MFRTGEDGAASRPWSFLRTTITSVVTIAALSWLAAGWLSSATRDHETLARLAGNVSDGVPDPLTTGSIASRASATRLDPCTTRR